MTERPALKPQLDSNTFLNFYYLKEELVDFCRKNGLPASGGKRELTEQIAQFLATGAIPPVATAPKRAATSAPITENSKIEPNFVCSQRHRAFFKEQLGSRFSFNVPFQKWLKNNPGKTYKEAVAAYGQLLERKKEGKPQIDPQFEYNTYIRDFFADNQGKSLAQAIRCWNYKKQLPGRHCYERADLDALG